MSRIFGFKIRWYLACLHLRLQRPKGVHGGNYAVRWKWKRTLSHSLGVLWNAMLFMMNFCTAWEFKAAKQVEIS